MEWYDEEQSVSPETSIYEFAATRKKVDGK